MNFSYNDVIHIADLAHLKLKDDEATILLKDMNNILKYVDKLNEVDVSNIELTVQITDMPQGLREDIPNNYSNKNDFIKEFPTSENNYIKVPKVI